jgi:tetratricopeptide (TPR) repeat protein
MRSADLRWSIGGAALLCALSSGCSTLNAPLQSLREVVSSAPAPVAQAASAPAASPAAAAASAVAAKPVVAEVVVSPATQRAFDESLRALRAGRIEEAERGLSALAAAHPELGGPKANLGLIYRQAGKWAEATAAFEQAVKANPQQAQYLNHLGIAYREQGRFGDARGAYEQAIALDPAYAPAVLNLGILNDLYLRDSARALELYDRYLLMSPTRDASVAKWVVDLRNRKPAPAVVSKKEQP